jgi:hypothetical protein
MEASATKGIICIIQGVIFKKLQGFLPLLGWVLTLWWGSVWGWVFVYVWRLQLQRKLYIQGVIFEKLQGFLPVCVCMEA